MTRTDLVEWTENGLYCRAGGFYIDPWRPVPKAVITHGHADHARWGCDEYLCAAEGEPVLRARLGESVRLRALDYAVPLDINGLKLSLHPAGHILGSAQVRLEHRGKVVVATGDVKTDADATCRAFEPVRCHTLITESTFGLPVFRWPSREAVFREINVWWRQNRSRGNTSVLFAYALGKAQRILAGLDASIGPIFTHGAVEKFNRCYRTAGVRLPDTVYVGDVVDKKCFEGAMVIAPPSADTPAWTKKFPSPVRGFASGWMRIRGHRRRRSVDRGFVLSDHADWDGLLAVIDAAGAESVGVTHGYATELARWLQEKGLHAEDIQSPYGGAGEPEIEVNTE
jgi:putative mRNA 3-end processing factor